MILKVTVLKSGVDVFSVNIDGREQAELSTGVKAALDEFHRLSPKTKLLGGDIQIKLDKAKAPHAGRRAERLRCRDSSFLERKFQKIIAPKLNIISEFRSPQIPVPHFAPLCKGALRRPSIVPKCFT
jgi:hypothetical protein